MEKKRCKWCDITNELYVKYHDEEWGVPLHNDQELFEFLCLEGMQAGLSWISILKKRQNFRIAFDSFIIEKVAQYDDEKVLSLLQDKGIIRNKLKINSVISNAKIYIEIQKEWGSFDCFIWSFVNNKPIKNAYTLGNMPAKTPLSEKISADLKKRGMKFVGPVIIYSFMQAVGMVNDHQPDCFRYDL